MISATSVLFALCFVLSVFHTSVFAEPTDVVTRNGSSCKQVLQRKEWRTLTNEEKKSYIDAVKCLQSIPAHDKSRPASWTRFDEFLGTHIDLATKIHFVAQFLPWHRLFMKSYENALRNECGYKGAQPYWDWSIDADPPNLLSKSPLWDPITGFGGSGVPGTYVVPTDPDPSNSSQIYPVVYTGGGCVGDGPFANLTIHTGPGLLWTEHCLTRAINDLQSHVLNSTALAHYFSFPTYAQFNYELDGPFPFTVPAPHGAGHATVGGDMANPFSSAGDPIFYLHHSGVDRFWWRWQQVAPERLYEISGRTAVTPPYGNVTLDYPLNMGSVGHTRPIRELMDIRQEPLCYVYV